MKNEANEATFFVCKFCDYKCKDKYNFNRHLLTDKHKIKQIKTQNEAKIFNCECGKNYSRRSSLYNHKKTCKFLKEKEKEKIEEKNDKTEILIKKIEQLEETLKDKSNISNITNNHFNLNIFLNEKCKDAINILEFKKLVQESILNISENMKLNINDAITNAINISYNNLEDFEKPYYTIDKARNKLAVKDENNKWIKDNNDIIYNNLKTLQDPYFKIQLENFYKNVKDKDNMSEKEEEKFINLINNTTSYIDKNKFLNKLIDNGKNPKLII